MAPLSNHKEHYHYSRATSTYIRATGAYTHATSTYIRATGAYIRTSGGYNCALFTGRSK
jgi:hypothetical protein